MKFTSYSLPGSQGPFRTHDLPFFYSRLLYVHINLRLNFETYILPCTTFVVPSFRTTLSWQSMITILNKWIDILTTKSILWDNEDDNLFESAEIWLRRRYFSSWPYDITQNSFQKTRGLSNRFQNMVVVTLERWRQLLIPNFPRFCWSIIYLTIF